MRRERWLAAAVSVAAHVAILVALLTARVPTPVETAPPAVTVLLVHAPAPAKAAPAKAAPAKSAPVRARRTVTRTAPDTIAAVETVASAASNGGAGDLLSGAALGSAAAADSLPGGACDMARRLQNALRRDALVRTAVAARGGPGAAAILVWNGGWVASPGEDGRGLAAVREAIVWEVAFAPAACREGRVHGPVLFTVSDASGLARIAIGSGDWRWGDLVSSR